MREHREDGALQQRVAVALVARSAQAARHHLFHEQVAREQLGIEARAARIEALEHAFERLRRAAGGERKREGFAEKSSVQAQAWRWLEQIRQLHLGAQR